MWNNYLLKKFNFAQLGLVCWNVKMFTFYFFHRCRIHSCLLKYASISDLFYFKFAVQEKIFIFFSFFLQSVSCLWSCLWSFSEKLQQQFSRVPSCNGTRSLQIDDIVTDVISKASIGEWSHWLIYLRTFFSLSYFIITEMWDALLPLTKLMKQQVVMELFNRKGVSRLPPRGTSTR